MPALAELKTHLAEIEDLGRAQSVLHWDMEVWMPPGGGAARSKQLATLAAIIHDRSTSDRIGELLDAVEPSAETLPADDDDRCLVRLARYEWDKARRIPTEWTAEFTEAQARSYQAWVTARENDDFAAFRPWLERMLELRREYVEFFAPYDDPYDVLLDDFEQGMKTDEVRTIFARLQPELTALVAEHASDDDGDILHGSFPTDLQDALSREVIGRFGVDWNEFRLDLTVHPFEVTFGAGDVRLTTRYAEDDVNSLFTAMHEAGHGLYEHGIDRALDRTPLQHGVSSALHESQSRMWENVVGRSLPFWRWFYPRLQETFSDHFGGVRVEEFHRAVNRARRSYIRVDADETSYGLHIILRFELEQELVAGRLAVKDLPDAWKTRFEELIGLRCPGRQARRPSGLALGRRRLRLLPDLPPRQRPLGPDLGAREGGDPGRRGADRARRLRRAARLAAREPLRARVEVHPGRDDRARRRRPDRPRAVPRVPARQARDRRDGLTPPTPRVRTASRPVRAPARPRPHGRAEAPR